MSTIKDEARKLIENLPDGASWDDLMYQIYVRQKVEEGLRAANEGRVVDQEEAERRMAKWLTV